MGEPIERLQRRLKLQDLRILLWAVHDGSMGRAARRLGTSQPAISRSISELETLLGAPLVDRTPRGVQPTEYSRAFLQRCTAAFDELRQGLEDVAFLADPMSGELRIACTESIAAGPVFRVIERLSRQYPRIKFQITTQAPPALYRELTDRKVELAMSGVGATVPKDCTVIETLIVDSLAIAAAPNNPWARCRKISLSELVDQPWVLLPSDNLGTVLLVEAFVTKGLKPPRASVVTDSLHLRNRLLSTGRFLTALPGFLVRFEGKELGLRALPVELPTTQRAVGIIKLKNRSLSRLAQFFIEEARKIVQAPT